MTSSIVVFGDRIFSYLYSLIYIYSFIFYHFFFFIGVSFLLGWKFKNNFITIDFLTPAHHRRLFAKRRATAQRLIYEINSYMKAIYFYGRIKLNKRNLYVMIILSFRDPKNKPSCRNQKNFDFCTSFMNSPTDNRVHAFIVTSEYLNNTTTYYYNMLMFYYNIMHAQNVKPFSSSVPYNNNKKKKNTRLVTIILSR